MMFALQALRRRAIASKFVDFGKSQGYASSRTISTDVIIVGAGHNGLIAATLLAQQGLKVDVLEEKSLVGGACKTERPFKNAPGLAQSTGAYLLGVMPPELIKLLDLKLVLRRRDPHYFLPTTDGRYLLFGSDEEATKRQFINFFSKQDWESHCALQNELAALREDVAPSWLAPPLSVEATALKFVRPELQEIYISLCRGSVRQYLDRFNFKSDLLKAMYATTDGFSGLTAGWDTMGGGHNFLVHNMCRLKNSNGTWMIVEGGMGQVTQRLAKAATETGGVNIITDCPVEKIEIDSGSGAVVGVVAKGELRRAKVVVVNADPYRLQTLVGPESLGKEVNASLEAIKRPGMTMKVNLALSALPVYSCLPEDHGQHRTTTHLLPDESNVIESIERAFQDATNGKLPEFPTIEVYTQTAVDHKLQDSEHRHSAALFVQWVPNKPAGSSWDVEKEGYVAHLLSIWERFAPGVSKLVDDVFPLAPPDIEDHFGITGGHIHHIDNTYACADRFPHVVPGISGLYSCSAGTHPAGSVVGAAGYNAAMAVKKDLLLLG